MCTMDEMVPQIDGGMATKRQVSLFRNSLAGLVWINHASRESFLRLRFLATNTPCFLLRTQSES